MNVGIFLSWMVCGLLVGLIARLLVPGGQKMGLLLTMVLGMVGAIVGGAFYAIVQGAPSEPYSLVGDAWPGWLLALVGAMLVIWIYGTPYRTKWRQ